MLRTYFPFASALALVVSCASSDEGDTDQSGLGSTCASTEATCPAPSASAPGTSSSSPVSAPEGPLPESEPEPATSATNGPLPGEPSPDSAGGAPGEGPADALGGSSGMGEPSFEPAEPEPTEPEPPEPEPQEPEPTQSEPEVSEPEPTAPEPDAQPGGDAGTTPGDALVPDIEFCAEVTGWEPEWSQWEDEVLLLVNENRALGADCGSEGSFGPAGPLSMDPLLRCTARVHSLDMYQRMFFDHTNPDGDGPGERLDAAGYEGFTWGENIAQGYPSPEDVVVGWMDSDGHCSNIMQENFTLLGVGYLPGDTESPFSMNQHYWTQNFGAEQGGFGGDF